MFSVNVEKHNLEQEVWEAVTMSSDKLGTCSVMQKILNCRQKQKEQDSEG
jgi:hypothetical protein